MSAIFRPHPARVLAAFGMFFGAACEGTFSTATPEPDAAGCTPRSACGEDAGDVIARRDAALPDGGADAMPPDPPGDRVANVWIDSNGGSCTVSATPIPYEGAGDAQSCDSFDAAWDAMADGQLARVVAGTYGPQRITGDKTAETRIVGDSKHTTIVTGNVECFEPAEFGSASALCAMGDYLTLEAMRLDSGRDESNSSSAARPDGEHVTFIDVDLYGDFPNMYVSGAYFTWRRGSHGEDGVIPPPRRCDRSYGLPVWVDAPHVTLDGIRFNVKLVAYGAGPYCGADDVPHLENIRIESPGDDLTIENSWFVEGSDAGSGHVFTSTRPTGLVVRNNYFEAVNGTYAMQGGIGEGGVFAYNTFEQGVALENDATWIGNLGAYSGCDGTHVRNVWEGSGSCGSDTFVGGASLGIEPDGTLAASSPAIDAAETQDDGDYCTHALGGADRHGDARPAGTACDAGADERRAR
jgi:hypothetical protein